MAAEQAFAHLLAPLRVGALSLRSRVVMRVEPSILVSAPRRALPAFFGERARHGVALLVVPDLTSSSCGRLAWQRVHRDIAHIAHERGAYAALALHGCGDGGDSITRSAETARALGYDGVEVDVTATAVESQDVASGAAAIVKSVRRACGSEFFIAYRVCGDALTRAPRPWRSVIAEARAAVDAGADALLADVGPSQRDAASRLLLSPSSTLIPPGGFAHVAARLRNETTPLLGVPVIATAHRLTSAHVAERLLKSGQADLVALGAPLLADAALLTKARLGVADEIVPVLFSAPSRAVAKSSSVSVVVAKSAREHIAVIGAGAAGLACSLAAARRGHCVTLYERRGEVGGTLRAAAVVPSRSEEASRVLAYFEAALRTQRFCGRVTLQTLADITRCTELPPLAYRHIIMSTGARLRDWRFDAPRGVSVQRPDFVLSRHAATIGPHVVVLFRGDCADARAQALDVVEYLTAAAPRFCGPAPNVAADDGGAWLRQWRAPPSFDARRLPLVTAIGNVPEDDDALSDEESARWRAAERRGVVRVHDVAAVKRSRQANYLELHMCGGGAARSVYVDTIVLCGGARRGDSLLEMALRREAGDGARVHVIGGARHGARTSLTKSLDDGTRLGESL